MTEERPAQAAPNLTPPPGNPRFPLFDSLRAVAALSVFAGHTVTGTVLAASHPTLFGWAAQLSYEGVAIFFLISGFLLYRPFLVARRAGRRLALGDYARRRFLRIVPAYWVALSLCLLVGFVSGITAGNWWIFYGFGQVYSSVKIAHGIGAAWTLCVEVTFYAALPVFAWLAARLSRRPRSLTADLPLLIVLAAASLGFRAHFSSFLQAATVSTLPGTFVWFALGMGLAIASVSGQERTAGGAAGWASRLRAPSTLSWALALGLFLLLRLVNGGGAHLSTALSAVTVHALYGVIALFVLLPAVFNDTAGGLARRVLRVPALAWVGMVSYAFYLYHTIVIEQVNQRVHTGHLAVRYLVVTIVALPLSLAAAAASYYLLERPIMRIRPRPRPVRA